MPFSILLSAFISILFLCEDVLSREVPRIEDNVQQHLQRQEEGLQKMRDALEKALESGQPAIPSDEELQRMQEWLDNARQGRYPPATFSDEELQRRQEWLDNARQGRTPSSFSDEELQQIKQRLEEAEQQLQALSEERRRLDASMAHKETIETLLRKGFAHREQITSGQMDITYRTTRMDRNGRLENEGTREITLAFDEERQRIDKRGVFRHNPSAGDNTPFVAVGCIGCYNEDNRLLVLYSRYVKTDDPISQSVLSIYDTGLEFKGHEATSLWTEQLGIIPQYIVYFSTNRFPTKKTIENAKNRLLSTTVGILGSGITEVTVIEEEYKGIMCKKITFDSKYTDGAVALVTLWIAEGQGHALRKLHRQISGTRGLDVDELLEVDVALDKDSGIWFPSAWRYERHNNGRLWLSEEGMIKNVVLNKPISERVFTMQDIEIIPAGVMVLWNTELVPPPHGARRIGSLIWDGNDFVTRGMFTEGLIAQMAAQNRSERFQTMILVNIAVIGLILSIFFWRMYQRVKLQN